VPQADNVRRRFVRGSKPLSAGRPPGALNKTTRVLKEAIIRAAEEVGGEEGLTGYLKMLAVQNTAAFASLLSKVLPTQLAADEESGGLGVRMVFERHIVWPDGRREIEGVTPKSLPAPHVLPSSDESKADPSKNQ
jgi:hypothetical protein